MPHDAAYWKEYRQRRKEYGNPVPASKNHGKHGKNLTKWKRAKYVAWDGEGATINGIHQYIFLANSEGGELWNENGLSTVECLEFMVSEYTRLKTANHVFFAFSYDCNMILKDVKPDIMKTIHHRRHEEDKHHYTNLEIDGVKLAVNYVNRHTLDIFNGVTKKKARFWDVWGFYQGSFVQAMGDYLSQSYEDFQTIRDNKARRENFHPSQKEQIISYCRMELIALVLMQEKLHKAIQEAGLSISRYDGAGNLATALFRLYETKQYMEQSPDAVYDAATYAYAGGRSELVHFGNSEQPVYAYDINSAYPAAMPELPCLKHGRWVHHTPTDTMNHPEIANPFTLYKVEWRFREGLPFYPFHWRNEQGNIYFPPMVIDLQSDEPASTWIWSPEYKSALDWCALYGEWFRVQEAWEFIPACDHQPFNFVPAVYKERQRLKALGNMAQWALKLGINSLYGKMAQQVGSRPFFQLEWAGYVTSKTRASLLLAAILQPQSVVMFATDAVYTMEKLALPVSKELGEWEFEEHDGGTFVQSGIYWLKDKECAHLPRLDHAECSRWHAKQRGILDGTMPRERVIEAWDEGKRSLTGKTRNFYTLARCAAGQVPWSKWCQWEETDRELDIVQQRMSMKRIYHDYDSTKGKWKGKHRPTNSLLFCDASTPFSYFGGMSAPFAVGGVERPKEFLAATLNDTVDAVGEEVEL